jgi:hypothetical protein
MAVRVGPDAAREAAPRAKAAAPAAVAASSSVAEQGYGAPARAIAAAAGCYDLTGARASLVLPPRAVLDTMAVAGDDDGQRGFAVRAPAGSPPLGYARAYWLPTTGDSVRVVLLDAGGSGVVVRARVDAAGLRGAATLVEPGRSDVPVAGAVVAPRCSGR